MKNLSEGNITKQVLSFMVPVLIGNTLQRVYTLVDTILVGRLIDTHALAAVGAASVIALLLIVICNGFTSGFSIVIGQYYGAGDTKRLKNALAGTYVLSLIIGVLLTVAGLLLIKPLLSLTNVPPELHAMAESYLFIVSAGLIFSILYNMMASVLRALGDSIAPLVFLVVSVVLNSVLDYVFIAILKQGVKGVAVATVIAQSVSGIACVVFSYFKRPVLAVKKIDFYLPLYIIKQLLSQGFAMSLMLSIVSVGSVILQSGINILGSNLLAGYTAGRKYLEFFMMPGGSLAMTAAAFTSQNYGAKKIDRIQQGTQKMILMGWIWTTVAIAIIFLFGENLITSVTGRNVDRNIIDNGIKYLRIGIPFFYALIVLVIVRSVLQGMNLKRTPVVASIIELSIKIASILFLVPRLGYIGICITEPVIWILGAIWVYPIYRYAIRKYEKKNAINSAQ